MKKQRACKSEYTLNTLISQNQEYITQDDNEDKVQNQISMNGLDSFVFNDCITKKSISVRQLKTDLIQQYQQSMDTSSQQLHNGSLHYSTKSMGQMLTNSHKISMETQNESIINASLIQNLKDFQSKALVEMITKPAIQQIKRINKMRSMQSITKQTSVLGQLQQYQDLQKKISYTEADKNLFNIQKGTLRQYLQQKAPFNPQIKKLGLVSISKMTQDNRQQLKDYFIRSESSDKTKYNEISINNTKLDPFKPRGKQLKYYKQRKRQFDMYNEVEKVNNPLIKLEEIRTDLMRQIKTKIDQQNIMNASHLIDPPHNHISKFSLNINKDTLLQEQFQAQREYIVEKYGVEKNVADPSNNLALFEQQILQMGSPKSYLGQSELNQKQQQQERPKIDISAKELVQRQKLKNQMEKQQRELVLPQINQFETMTVNKSVDEIEQDNKQFLAKVKNKFLVQEEDPYIAKFFLRIQENDIIELKYLLKIRSNLIKLHNKNGDFPLHYACKKSNEQTLQYLIDQGADLKSKNYDNKTPLQVAEMYKRDKLIVILKDFLDRQLVQEMNIRNSLLRQTNAFKTNQ